MSELPNGWTEAKLKDVTDQIQYGYTASSSLINSGPQYLRITDIQDDSVDWDSVPRVANSSGELAQYLLNEGDIVFARTGATVGKSFLIRSMPSPAVFASYLIRVICNNGGVMPEYANQFFQSPIYWAQIKEGATGTGQPNFNGTKLKELRIPLSPLPEQRRIVAKVDGLTARTARARKELDRIPTLIARYKERLLDQIFKTLDRVSDRQPIRELSSFVTSGSRGWAKYYSETGDLFVRVGNVQRTNIKIDLSKVQYVHPPSGAEGQRTRLEANDLLVTITADLGRIGVYTDDRVAYINQHVALARLNDPGQAQFIAWYLSSEPGQVQLHRNTRGATKAGLGLDDIRDVLIPRVAENEQAEIVRRIESAFGWLDRMAADHATAARLLPKLNAAILAKAFRGELVPQDPNDEPAGVLLERVKAERAAAPKKSKKRKLKNGLLLASTDTVPVAAFNNSPRSKGKVAMTKSRHDDDVWEKPYLATLLKKSKISNAQGLFKVADLPVADFYKQLAWEIDALHIIDDPKELKAG